MVRAANLIAKELINARRLSHHNSASSSQIETSSPKPRFLEGMFSALKNVGKFVGLSSSQTGPADNDDGHNDDMLISRGNQSDDGEESPVVRRSNKSKKGKSIGEVEVNADVEQDVKPKKKKKRVSTESNISDAGLQSPQLEPEAVDELLLKKRKRSRKSVNIVEGAEVVNGEQDVQETDIKPPKSSKKAKKSKKASSEEGAVDGEVEASVEAEFKPKRKAKTRNVTKSIEDDAPDEVMDATLEERDAEEISELINSQLSSHKKPKSFKKLKGVEEETQSKKAAKTQDYFEHDPANDSLVPPPEPLDSLSSRHHSTGSSENDILAASQLQYSQSPVKESPPPTTASKKSAASRKRKDKATNVTEAAEEPKKVKRSKNSKSHPEHDTSTTAPVESNTVPESPSGEVHSTGEDQKVHESSDLDQAPPSPQVSPKARKAKPSKAGSSSWSAINASASSETSAMEDPKPSIYKATPKSAKKRSIPVDIAELPGSAQSDKRARPSAKKPKTSSASNREAPKSSTRPRPESCTAKGKVSPVEEKLIKAAIEKFRDINNMTDYEVNELIKQNGQHGKAHDLWEWVNQDLPSRERLSIIRYARRKFHNYPKRGGWNEDEDEELRTVHAKLGNNWKKISDVIQRHPEDVRDRWRNYLICEDKMNNSSWEESEETALREAVAKFYEKELAYRREQSKKGHNLSLELDEADIQWPKVSEYMDHRRSRLQCSTKWKQLREREAPAPRLRQENIPPPTNTWRQRKAAEAYDNMKTGDKYTLVTSIRDSRAGRESRIPWNKLGDAEYREKFSAMIMKVAWTKLKSRVEGYDKMPLQEVVGKVLDAFKRYSAKQLAESYEGEEKVKRKYTMPRKETASINSKRKAISAEHVYEDDDEAAEEDITADQEIDADAEARNKAERKAARKERKAAKLRHRMSRNGESQEPEEEVAADVPEVPETQDQPPTPEADVTMTDADWDVAKSGRRFREKLNRASQEAAVARAFSEASIDEEDVHTSTPKRLSSPFKYKKVASTKTVDESDS